MLQSAVGQLRFGSTPLDSIRVSLARPSGFAALRKVRPRAGGIKLGSCSIAFASCCTSATVLASLPAWMPPTIRAVRDAWPRLKSTSERCSRETPYPLATNLRPSLVAYPAVTAQGPASDIKLQLANDLRNSPRPFSATRGASPGQPA